MISVLLTIHIRWIKLKYGVMTEHWNGWRVFLNVDSKCRFSVASNGRKISDSENWCFEKNMLNFSATSDFPLEL